MSFTISQLLPTDWKKYKQIRLETVQSEPTAFPNIYETLARYKAVDWQNLLKDSESVFFIAESQSKPVGIIRITFNDMEVDKDTAYIGGLYVNDEFRKMGIATALFDSVTQEAQNKEGIGKMRLWVRDTQISAIHLYEKIGFTRVGECDDVSDDGLTTSKEIIMEKILSPSSQTDSHL